MKSEKAKKVMIVFLTILLLIFANTVQAKDLGTVTISGSKAEGTLKVTPATLTGIIGDTFSVKNNVEDADITWKILKAPAGSGVEGASGSITKGSTKTYDTSTWACGTYIIEFDPPGAKGNLTVTLSTSTVTVESSDAAGNKTDIFIVGDKVYAYGSGYSASTTYDLYVVGDTIWTHGMTIPPRVPGTATTFTTDSSGNIDPTLIWGSGVQGKYDIIVDVDGNGNYDEGIDALDDMDVNDAGFEVPSLTPIGIIALIGLLLVVAISRIKRQ